MADDSLYYTIQEVSEKLSIPIPKLRRWDTDGLLNAQRSAGGHRRYLKELIDRLAVQSISPDKTTKELAAIKKSLAQKQRIIQLLLESEHRYRDLVETSRDLIWATDPQGRFTYVNNAALDIFGLSPQEMIGRCFFNFETGDSRIANRRVLTLLKRNGEVKNHVARTVTAQCEDRWLSLNGRAVLDENGKLTGLRGTMRDITEQHLTNQRIKHLALHDTLTELPNRIALQQSIEGVIDTGAPGAILFLDMDHFKYVNENFGHRAGDQLIKGVGSALRGMMRDLSGDLFRLGGDEFAIHLPGALRQEAIQAAERALETVQHYRFQGGNKKGILNISVSIGIALYPFHGSDNARLLSNVDIAMYQAKELGRNRYVLFDQGSENMRATRRRTQWAKTLRHAIDNDRLVLFAQPVVRLIDQKPVHHEILLRIRDDDGKIVMPASFIEIAESLGMIQELDLRVVEKLLLHMHQHKQMGKKVRYFVNLSRVSISDQSWVKRLIDILSASKADPNQLVFEITETAAMSEIDVTLNFIKKLKDVGCRIALDDFGAGFSSFYYLKRFGVDYLKIDGSFIRDLAGEDGSNHLFVKALNDVAKGMEKQVIAEWVETPETLRLLQNMGAQFGQGYLFQRPAPLDGNQNYSFSERINAA